MSEHVEQTVSTQAAVADAGSFQVEVDTSGADRLLLFVDDNAGNAPASYDLDVEVAYNDVPNPDWMPRSSVTSSTATHNVYTDIAPFRWRFTVTNSSGAAADYRVRAVSIDED